MLWRCGEINPNSAHCVIDDDGEHLAARAKGFILYSYTRLRHALVCSSRLSISSLLRLQF